MRSSARTWQGRAGSLLVALKLLVLLGYKAFSYECMRVWGLKLLVYAALSY
jgi:hypothetical protein